MSTHRSVRSAAPRRLIAIGLGLVWIMIAGVFAVALFEKQPTEIIYTEGDLSLTLRSNQRVSLLFWQCVTVDWDAENLSVYKRPPLPNISEPLPAQGTQQACNIENTAVFVGTQPGSALFFDTGLDNKVEFYPDVTWVSPTFLILAGLAATALALWLWKPGWFPLEAEKSHSLLTPLMTILVIVLAFKSMNFLATEYVLAEPLALGILLSLIGFFVLRLFSRSYRTLFKAACLGVVIVVSLAHLYALLNIPGALQYDEKYYASMAATQAAGLGLYPYLQDFPPMPIMGGGGYMISFYTLAYQTLGPYLTSLRFVAWVVSVLGFPAIFLLFKRWYGSAAAWLAIALIPTTYLYGFAYSIRMDLFTLTWLWWALLFVDVARKRDTGRWHFFAGFFLALGLQVHLDTSVTTIACGLLYVVDAVRQLRARNRLWPRAMLICGLGVAAGLGIYVVFNILPDSYAFFHTVGGNAGSGRGLTTTIAQDTPMLERVTKSLLSLDRLARNFMLRIVNLIVEVPTTDLILWVFAFYALVVRRFKADRDALVLLIGALIAAFFILNNESLLYTTHLIPVLYLCLPAAFTHGVSRRVPILVQAEDISFQAVYILLTLLFPLCIAIGITWPQTFNIQSGDLVLELAQEQITFIHTHVSTDCKIMGPGDVYLRAFLRYPRFSSFSYDALFGLAYYETEDRQQLFFLNNPDIIFEIQGTNLTFENTDVTRFIEDHHFKEIAPQVWIKTEAPLSPNCLIS